MTENDAILPMNECLGRASAQTPLDPRGLYNRLIVATTIPPFPTTTKGVWHASENLRHRSKGPKKAKCSRIVHCARRFTTEGNLR